MEKEYKIKSTKMISPKYKMALDILNGVATEVEVPDGCTRWESDIFYKNTYLQKIILPNSIKELDGLCFNGCTNLEKVEYKGTIEEWNKIQMGYGVFIDTPLLTEIICTDGTVVLEE